MTHLDSALEAIASSGLIPPDSLEITGKVVRWAGDPSRPRRRNLWYWSDGEWLSWGDWAGGGKLGSYRLSDNSLELTPYEKAAIERKRIQATRDREATYAEAKAKARRIYDAAPDCCRHDYLKRKGVTAPSGLKTLRDGRLVVPVRGRDGEIQSLQFVATDGRKRFLTGGEMKGGWFLVGTIVEGQPIAIAEGLATAASIHEATGWPCYVAFSCSGFEAVCSMVRAQRPDAQIIVCSDVGNGSKQAREAAIAIDAVCVVPNGPDKSDFNDMAAAQGLEAVKFQLEAALAIATLIKAAQKVQQRWHIDPHSTVNERYLSELPDELFLAIKSAKGTNKTGAIAELLRWLENRKTALTHRRALGGASGERFDLPFHEFGGDLVRLSGCCICIDSLIRLERKHWGRIIVIDEVEQFIVHLLLSTTDVAEHRAQTIQLLAEMLQQAERIIIADADLSPVALRFIEVLSGRKFHVLENTYKGPDLYPIYHYERRETWLNELKSTLDSGKRVLVLTDSQKAKNKGGKWSSQALEGWIGERFPQLKVLRIDSESLADPNHPAYGCVVDINEVILYYDVVIASPSIETGVSIDIRGHFDMVFGVFCGHLPENSTRQFLARLRENVPRHICLPTKGLCETAGGGTETWQIMGSHKAAVKAIRQRYLDEFTVIDEAGYSHTNNVALDTWAAICARQNLAVRNYREIVLGMLAIEGHTITEVDCVNVDKTEQQLLGECKDVLYAVQTHEKVNAPDTDDREFERLNTARSLTRPERNQLEKAKLARRYLVAVCPQLVALDDDGLYSKLRLLFFATVGREHLPKRDKAILAKGAEHGQFAPDTNRALYGHRVALLEALGIPAMLADRGREFRATDADVIELHAAAFAHRKAIKALLGFWIPENSTPMHVLSLMLDRLGLTTHCVKREGPRGARVRVYRLDDLPLHLSILDAWLAREKELVSTASNKGVV